MAQSPYDRFWNAHHLVVKAPGTLRRLFAAASGLKVMKNHSAFFKPPDGTDGYAFKRSFWLMVDGVTYTDELSYSGKNQTKWI